MHSIQVKITAITIAAILVSILIVVSASFFTIEAENDRSTAEKMNLLSQNVQKNLDAYLTSIEQSVEMAANIAGDSLDSVALVEGGVAGTAAKKSEQTPEQAAMLDSYLAEHSAKIQEAFSSVANHTQGVVTYYYCIDTAISENEHGFFYSKVGKTGFEEQKPLDARDLDPDDIEHTTWYYTPVKRGRPSWVGPYTAHYLNEIWTMSYLVPIYKAGTLVGVLGMDVFYDTLMDQIKPIKVYQTGFACLLDTDGKVIYHPYQEIGSSVDDIIDNDLLKEENSGDKLIRYTDNGEDWEMAFSTLSSGMKLIVTAPAREINASWRHLTQIIMLATIVIIIVFSVVMMIIMGVITRPLQHLTAASSRLADGDYDVELSYKGKDEVGTLTKAFSLMRDHIKEYTANLNKRVYTDDLTGLANMRHFIKLARRGRERMAAEGVDSAILYFNLIGMKNFNRQYGFEEGNRLIREIADILRNHYGEENCCRVGQDHFAVLTKESGAAEELKQVFAQIRDLNDGYSLLVRVGIYADRLGVVDIDEACSRAKYACDQHRSSYVSDYYYFSEEMLKQAETQRYIVSSLDRALSEKWIQVYYQPIIRAATGRVCDEEALSRWFDPVKGFISPGEFIPVLESARLIYKLDLYVLGEIIRKMNAQKEAGLYVVPQSLNLSRMDFESCDIIEEIRSRVDAAGIPRGDLTIELTESAVGQDFDFIKEQVEKLREMGFKVWMDDFGSGYSSLDVLQNIHFDLIKFDMRFLQGDGDVEKSKVIIAQLAQMAAELGVETVAEGVETKEQAEFLKNVGVVKLQGYFYSKALPPEEIMERYEKGTQIGFEEPGFDEPDEEPR